MKWALLQGVLGFYIGFNSLGFRVLGCGKNGNYYNVLGYLVTLRDKGFQHLGSLYWGLNHKDQYY